MPWVTSGELEELGLMVVIWGDVDGPDVPGDVDGPDVPGDVDDSPDVVTPGVTDDDDDAGCGVPQIQIQPGGLVGAGVVEPGVVDPGDVDGPDVPGDVEEPEPVVLEPRRYGIRPAVVPVEEPCPEVVVGPDVPGVVDGPDVPGEVDGPDVPSDVDGPDVPGVVVGPDVPGDVDELEGSLYGMYPVGAVDDEGDVVVVEGSL